MFGSFQIVKSLQLTQTVVKRLLVIAVTVLIMFTVTQHRILLFVETNRLLFVDTLTVYYL